MVKQISQLIVMTLIFSGLGVCGVGISAYCQPDVDSHDSEIRMPQDVAYPTVSQRTTDRRQASL